MKFQIGEVMLISIDICNDLVWFGSISIRFLYFEFGSIRLTTVQSFGFRVCQNTPSTNYHMHSGCHQLHHRLAIYLYQLVIGAKCNTSRSKNNFNFSHTIIYLLIHFQNSKIIILIIQICITLIYFFVAHSKILTFIQYIYFMKDLSILYIK